MKWRRTGWVPKHSSTPQSFSIRNLSMWTQECDQKEDPAHKARLSVQVWRQLWLPGTSHSHPLQQPSTPHLPAGLASSRSDERVLQVQGAEGAAWSVGELRPSGCIERQIVRGSTSWERLDNACCGEEQGAFFCRGLSQTGREEPSWGWAPRVMPQCSQQLHLVLTAIHLLLWHSFPLEVCAM